MDSIHNTPAMRLKAKTTFRRNQNTFTLKGQCTRTLHALIHAREKGITALEMSSWAYRLGAYIHVLRHDYGLEIETLKEQHPGGWHARYVLHTHVEIIEIETLDKEE